MGVTLCVRETGVPPCFGATHDTSLLRSLLVLLRSLFLSLLLHVVTSVPSAFRSFSPSLSDCVCVSVLCEGGHGEGGCRGGVDVVLVRGISTRVKKGG